MDPIKAFLKCPKCGNIDAFLIYAKQLTTTYTYSTGGDNRYFLSPDFAEAFEDAPWQAVMCKKTDCEYKGDPSEFERRLPRVVDYDEQWQCKTPTVVPLDEGEGTLLLLETRDFCPKCGRYSRTTRQTYVWYGTKDPELLKLGYGASVKHFFSSCNHMDCPFEFSG